jgi:hypothetical protein
VVFSSSFFSTPRGTNLEEDSDLGRAARSAGEPQDDGVVGRVALGLEHPVEQIRIYALYTRQSVTHYVSLTLEREEEDEKWQVTPYRSEG